MCRTERKRNSSTNHYGTDALTAVNTLAVPVLFIAADGDRTGGFDLATDARTMFAACPSQHKELAILPGTNHGEQLLGGATTHAADVALERLIETASPSML